MKKIVLIIFFSPTLMQATLSSRLHDFFIAVKETSAYAINLICRMEERKVKSELFDQALSNKLEITRPAGAPSPDALHELSQTVANNSSAISSGTESICKSLSITQEKLESLGKICAALHNVLVVVQVISAVKFCYSAAVGLKSWIAPDEGEKYARERKQQKEMIKSIKFAFHTCLGKNKNAEKDGRGLPTNCKEIAETFAQVLGEEKLESERNAYVRARKQDEEAAQAKPAIAQ